MRAFPAKFTIFLYLIFYLEDIELGSPTLLAIEIFNQITFHKYLVILAFIEAELAGRGRQILPSPLNSEPDSRARVKALSVSSDHCKAMGLSSYMLYISRFHEGFMFPKLSETFRKIRNVSESFG